MISIVDVCKKYEDFKAVDNLNLEIKDGSIVGLIGPNGAGKTTTINMLIGIIDLTQGKIIINNKSIKENPIEVKREIGYVSDDENQLLALKAIEYLNFVADMYSVPEDVRRNNILNLAERFDIKDELNSRMDTFSKGMKQKIMIIASLIHAPKFWVLDEPFNGLDPSMAYELKLFMKEYSEKGNIILLSSHNLDIVENLCNAIVLIKGGKKLYYGNVEELKSRFQSSSTLEEIYIEVFRDKKDKKEVKNFMTDWF